MPPQHSDFLRRVSMIPKHGLGLSVDVYSPNIFEVLTAMEERGLRFGYLELFKSTLAALEKVKMRLPSTLLEYHGEGLWLTQPYLESSYPLGQELALAAAHLRALGSFWMNHECAAKQIAGYSFGTYLPPLFTEASAEVTAGNIRLIQECLDRLGADCEQLSPLLLVELPPLTYFGFGDLSAAEFIRLVTEASDCGLVLDLGHVWTIYRYSGNCSQQPLADFLDEFVEEFPLDRVVQIHLAGLAPGAKLDLGIPSRPERVSLPLWVDAHAAPIPQVLFEMLERVIAHPNLQHLKGVAIEVDTKTQGDILEEYAVFYERFHRKIEQVGHDAEVQGSPDVMADLRKGPQDCSQHNWKEKEHELLEQYQDYVQAAMGNSKASSGRVVSYDVDPDLLALYSEAYLPHEILEWGGCLRDMFPETCRLMEAEGIPLIEFLEFWFRAPRPVSAPYDFFLLKLERFLEFVQDTLPHGVELAGREAEVMRTAYWAASEPVEI